MIEFRENAGVVSFRVRVQPGASRSEIVGEWQNALRIRLAAPARDDRANEALRRLMATYLKVPAGAVRITHGEHSRTKRVEIRGVPAKHVRAILAPAG